MMTEKLTLTAIVLNGSRYLHLQRRVGVGTDNGTADSDDSDGGGHRGAGGLVAMGLFLPIQYFEVHDSSL